MVHEQTLDGVRVEGYVGAGPEAVVAVGDVQRVGHLSLLLVLSDTEVLRLACQVEGDGRGVLHLVQNLQAQLVHADFLKTLQDRLRHDGRTLVVQGEVVGLLVVNVLTGGTNHGVLVGPLGLHHVGHVLVAPMADAHARHPRCASRRACPTRWPRESTAAGRGCSVPSRPGPGPAPPRTEPCTCPLPRTRPPSTSPAPARRTPY